MNQPMGNSATARKCRRTGVIRCLTTLLLICVSFGAIAQPSVARQWNEELLEAIRNDLARPPVHARNLYHSSAAMWDAWAAYDNNAHQVIHLEKLLGGGDIAGARDEAISFAAYRLLSWRFLNAVNGPAILASFDAKMAALGYDKNNTATVGDSPAALGNRIAATYIAFGLSDNSNEANNYANQFYEPVNDALVPEFPGNPDIEFFNRWQPLFLEVFVDQAGNVIFGGVPAFQSPEWGTVTPYSLSPDDLTIYMRDGDEYWVYHDPGPPPYIAPGSKGSEQAYKDGFAQVAQWSGFLDPTDGVMIDISPASRGDNTLGTNDGDGRLLNPSTGQPYLPQNVPAGDYYRVLAEFWADGPDSETPPGHWFTILNYVNDHPLVVKRLMGDGPVLDDLLWDLLGYLMLGGTMHDVAIAAWGTKGWYDYIRPISAIRYMCDNGQSSDNGQLSYHADGIPLIPGAIEVITPASVAINERHEHLGFGSIGEIALYAWRGPDFIANPATDTAGVGWILCEDWWPYQRPTFVTPPFAGYVSGHSTFSRAAAEVLTCLTGDEFFPGGLGEFFAPRDEFLVFEDGPSVDITLQWATYYDASDETSISRIYGGIHPTADDIPGRIMGSIIGPRACRFTKEIYNDAGFHGIPVFSHWGRVALVLLLLLSGLIANRRFNGPRFQ